MSKADFRICQRVAVFPGSFKPAHRGHISAIEYLCDRADVDAVRVIVSNRSRSLPGTNRALCGQRCADNLRFLLSLLNLNKPVSVSLAPHRAIDAATDLIEQACPGSTLLYCVGQEDVERGDDRYSSRIDHTRRNDVDIRFITIPAAARPVHATELRRLLASNNPDHGYADLLPPVLSAADKALYWQRVCLSVASTAALSRQKIIDLLDASPFADYQSLDSCAAPGIDPVFRLITADGKRNSVYYSGDCVNAGSFDDPAQPLPPRRLAVTVRVTRHLAKLCESSNWRPTRIRHWDKAHRLLVLDDPEGSCSLPDTAPGSSATELGNMAAASGQCLAHLHSCASITEPLWGALTDEIAHWRTSIAARLATPLPERLRRLLKPRQCLVHLNFRPEVLRWDGSTIELTRLERTGSFGDPAWDIATFLAALPENCTLMGFGDRFVKSYVRTRALLKDDQHDVDRCDRARLIAQHLAAGQNFQVTNTSA